MAKVNKRLHIKIRVIVTRPGGMSVGEAREKLQRTARTGIVQEGIDLAWIDWRVPSSGQHARGGTYLREDAIEALRTFNAAIHHEDTSTRIEVINEG